MTDARAVIAAVVLLLGVSACSGDDPEPILAPTPSSSAPSASAPSDPSTSPVAGSDQGVFVRGYFESIGRATQTGDPSEFLSMSSETCANCTVIATNIEDAFAGEKTVEGAKWQVERASKVDSNHDGEIWNVDVRTAEERWYDGSGDLYAALCRDRGA